MVKNHSKRIPASKTWNIERKAETFITKGNPSGHSEEFGYPLVVIFRDLLKLAKTKKEVRDILLHQEVLVDGIQRKDHRFVMGLMDVLTIPTLKKSYRLILSKKGKLTLIEADQEDSKPVKIIGKTCIGKKFQLNLMDGKNVLTDKKDFNVNDSVVYDFKTKSIKEHFKLEKGATIVLIGGKHVGRIATVEEISGDKLFFKEEKEVYETSKKYAYAIGKAKSYLKLE